MAKQYTQEELQEIVARDYGFQKELVKNIEVCGLWHLRFEVNGIRFYGSTPYHGALPLLHVNGYTTPYYCHDTPVTKEYYDEFIKDKEVYITHFSLFPDAETQDDGDWEDTGISFATQEEAKEFINRQQDPKSYSYDFRDYEAVTRTTGR